MNKNIKLVLILGLIAAFTRSAGASINDNAGTTGSAFLKIGTGGRPSAMAGAFTGIADDINSIYYNPAGLGDIKSLEFSAQQIIWLENITYQYLAVGKQTSAGALGLSFGYLSMDDLEKRSSDTDEYTDFEASDTLIGISYARGNETLSLGGSLKIIREKIEEENASAFAFDLGAKFKKTPINKLVLGAAVQNLGTKMKFINEETPLPVNIKVGAGYNMLGERLLLGMDFNMPNDENSYVALGAEYLIPISRLTAYLRGGFRTNSNNDAIDNLRGGAGLKWTSYIIDFSWEPYGNMGSAYRVSLQGRF
ncbi:MAG: PorV/PorQ family protein [Elusimicrobia bacterium]|jgi:hypothetical protein|nr:PorV/PorQ family protein [Elusimicrobiota bacterium]